MLLGVQFSEEEQDDALYAGYCNTLGSALAESGQYKLAIQYFTASERIFERAESWQDVGLAQFNLGNTHTYAGADRIGVQYYRKAIDTFSRASDGPSEIAARLTMANLLLGLGHMAAASEQISAVERLTDGGVALDPTSAWSFNTIQAKLALGRRDPAAAIHLLREARLAADRTENDSYRAEARAMLGQVLLQEGQLADAHALLVEAEAIFDALGDRQADAIRQLTSFTSQAMRTPSEPEPPTTQSRHLQADGPPAPEPRLPEEGRVAPSNRSVFIAQGVGGTRERFREILATEVHVSGEVLCVFHADDAYTVPLSSGTGVTVLATDALDVDALQAACRRDTEMLSVLLSIAHRLVEAGIKHRADEEFPSALNAYRFALHVAVLAGDTPGVETIAVNMLTVERAVRLQMRGRVVATWGGTDEAETEKLQAMLDVAASTARDLVPLLNLQLDRAARQRDERARLSLLVSIRRLLLASSDGRALEQTALPGWAGGGIRGPRPTENDIERRSMLTEVGTLARRLDNLPLLVESILEELSQAYLSELVVLGGARASISEYVASQLQETIEAEADEGTGFAQLWKAYTSIRRDSPDWTSPGILQACSLAVDHFEKLRSLAVLGGTSSGHVMSYLVAMFLGQIQSDLIRLLIAQGQGDTALEVAERSNARAMLDWMGRTHQQTPDRFVVRAGLIGSIGEVRPCSLVEIQGAAVEIGAFVLYYTAVGNGFVGWFIRPDGTFTCESLDVPGELLAELFRLLPLRDAPDRFVRSVRHFGDGPSSLPTAAVLDGVLDRLGTALIPPTVAQALKASKPSRLIVVTDGELAYVPFACLRLGGTYLVQQHDILYWPSVAAGRMCTQQELLWEDHVAEALPSIVAGDPAFTNPYVVRAGDQKRVLTLDRLSGAAGEARSVAATLGVAAVLDADASFSGVFGGYRRKSPENAEDTSVRSTYVPVLHLATHGVLFMDTPESSFVALADRPLTAADLYQYDPGYRTGLVTLSACQTGLGGVHPDSVIGLANAFLVAGACSVASTLWQVPDDATESLIVRFYERLSRPAGDGQDAADGEATRQTRRLAVSDGLSAALRQAQLGLLEHPTWQHPFFWGAFKVSGSDLSPPGLSTHRGG